MTAPQATRQPRYKTWAAWILVVLLLPMGAATLGVVYSLYLGLTTGSLTTLAKGIRASSTAVNVADSPVWFSVFFVLNVLFAVTLACATLGIARVAHHHLRGHGGTHS